MKLPKFLYNKIKKHSTSLGENPALPLHQNSIYDYMLIKKAYEKSYKETVNLVGEQNMSVTNIQNILSNLISECKMLEEPIKDNLEQLCENIIYRVFDVPTGVVEFECSLVNKIIPTHSFRIIPEDIDSLGFKFTSLDESEKIKKDVLKRRFINSLILGASYHYTNDILNYHTHESFIDTKLYKLYNDIMILNTFILFNVQEHISDKTPQQGSCVEVELGREDEVTLIKSQGLIFPFLLQDTIRGCFELFASHSLPKDNKVANFIIKQADFLKAEPWDLRFGIELWNNIMSGIKQNLIPYVFTNLCLLKNKKFNLYLNEILSNTNKGDAILTKLVNKANEDLMLYKQQTDFQKSHDDKELITDEFISIDEIDQINDDDYDDNGQFIDLLRNCTYSDIDFKETQIDLGIPIYRPIWQLIISVKGIEIPISLINLKAELVQLNAQNYYQLHINISPLFRNMGIGTKIFRQCVNILGTIVSLFSNEKIHALRYMNADITNSDTAFIKLWKSISRCPEIHVEYIKNKQNTPIGVIATLKQ